MSAVSARPMAGAVFARRIHNGTRLMTYRRRVVAVGERVTYETSRGSTSCTLAAWRKWAATAEVEA